MSYISRQRNTAIDPAGEKIRQLTGDSPSMTVSLGSQRQRGRDRERQTECIPCICQAKRSTFILTSPSFAHQTGLALFYTLLLIGQHEEVQNRLQREIDDWDQRESGPESHGSIDDNGREEEDMLYKGSYLEAVIRESLRLFPPVPRIARRMNQEVLVRGSVTGLEYTIPEGTTVTIDIFQIQRDPSVFPDPDSFRPERHLDPSCGTKSVFMPFSSGARSCIGSKFAMMELKIFLIQTLRQFRVVSKTPMQQIRLAIEIVLKPKNSKIEISFTERKTFV